MLYFRSTLCVGGLCGVLACVATAETPTPTNTPIPTWTPADSCGDPCAEDSGRLNCPRGFTAGSMNTCAEANAYVLRDNRGGMQCPDESHPDINPNWAIHCDKDPSDDVEWVFRQADMSWEVVLRRLPYINILDSLGDPATEVPSSAVQVDGSLYAVEGDTEDTAEIGVDAGFRIDYAQFELRAMGALTVTSPATHLQFFAHGWDVNAAVYVRPGRHALHADEEEAETFLLAPCPQIRAASIQVLDSATEEPSNLPTGDQVRLAVSVDKVDSGTLCSVTGTENGVACLGPLPAVSVPAGSTLSVRLDCFNGEDPCPTATVSVLAQLYCY